MIIRVKAELMNKSAGKWKLWKELEPLIAGVCLKHGAVEFDIVYLEEEMIKNVSVSYDTDKNFRKIMIDAGILAGQNDLKIELISQETLNDPSCSLIDQHKHKYKKDCFNGNRALPKQNPGQSRIKEGNETETIS